MTINTLCKGERGGAHKGRQGEIREKCGVGGVRKRKEGLHFSQSTSFSKILQYRGQAPPSIPSKYSLFFE